MKINHKQMHKPLPASPSTRKGYAGGYPAALLRPYLEQGRSNLISPPVKGELEGVWLMYIRKKFVRLNSALLFLLFSMLCIHAQAEEDALNFSGDGTLYGYATSTTLRSDSLLNPDNQFARLPQHTQTAEARFNFKAENDNLRLTLRPILIWQQNSNEFGEQVQSEGYVSQGQLRWRMAEAWNVAAGREVMNWGPAQFRSPSNPFYFDNGRSNPIRELSGLDSVKVSWTPDTRYSMSLGYIASSGHYEGPTDTWRDTWIFRGTSRGMKWAGGVAVAKKEGQQAFVGVDAQYNKSDELLLYGEAGSSTRPNALQSPADAAQPFSIEAESARHLNELVGATYTLDNGQSVSAEYLHQGHGFTASEEAAYFERAANATLPAGASTLGMALANVPPLLGRNYVHLVWQNNFLEGDYYWRLMWTRSLTDHGNQLTGYAEMTLSKLVSGFVLGVLPLGNERQEFSSMIDRLATAGIKVNLP